jgi:hypothetical protein
VSKILIIGSSYTIKDTFKKKYLIDELTFLDFRQLWDERKLQQFDKIILSGFHRKILNKNKNIINTYIEEYNNFVIYLLKHCTELYLISTFIPNKISFSRVVYFYQNLVIKIFSYKNIFVLSFPKIIDSSFKEKISYKILNIFKISFTEQNYLIKHTEKFILKQISKPKYFFLKIPRTMFLERLLRILDVNLQKKEV